MYIETSGRQRGDIAKLISPWLQFQGSMCLKFYYNMNSIYGAGIGTLKVRVNGIAYFYTAIWRNDNKWLLATIDVYLVGMYTVR